MHERVQKALDEAGFNYRMHLHKDMPIVIRSPKDFANALGYELERITKSLFLRCTHQGKYTIAVCSVNKKVRFSLIASHIGCKRVQVASQEELQDQVAYPPTGVSPIGVGAIPVFMDEKLFEFQTVLIGAGEIGVEIEIRPSHLKEITKAEILAIAA